MLDALARPDRLIRERPPLGGDGLAAGLGLGGAGVGLDECGDPAAWGGRAVVEPGCEVVVLVADLNRLRCPSKVTNAWCNAAGPIAHHGGNTVGEIDERRASRR
ncbi:hypothetical protein [Saccharothrix sp. ALI-22-I]|uniref:hypothetical protein n=1 Tax=Saccharothrix sp. ALI-22-I TaxID=1933778 RepID=UPI00117A2146|nr:hypothetical protein [Saccharothrix sp. ALI-22-I]